MSHTTDTQPEGIRTEMLQTGRHRASLVFITGLLAAALFSVSFDSAELGSARIAGRSSDTNATIPALAPFRPLTSRDLADARRAWSYFETNTRPATGLADSTAGYPSTTMWDQGSHLLALVSAWRIGVLDRDAFDARAARLLSTLTDLPLFDGKLPNKAYHTETLQMVDYANTVIPGGIGWSALDVSRMLLALRVLERHAPWHGEAVRALIANWDIAALAREGELVGATREDGEVALWQEGRIGYEQYAARAAALWGLDVIAAMSAGRVLAWKEVAGVTVAVDRRSHTVFRAITPTLSEPYMLQGLELGFDSDSALLAGSVYAAQEARHRLTGVPTMVSEDHIDREPWFLYAAVYSDGEDWAVVSDTGEHYPELRALSVKAVFAWDAIYNTPYTAALRDKLDADLTAQTGSWPAGIYEMTDEPNAVQSLNTNAVVLEALHYRAFGPLWSVD